MPSPVWQQIKSALDARLKTILVANGYQTDAGKNVFYWRTTDFAQDDQGDMPELPGIKYWESVEKTSALDIAIQDNTVSLNIQVLEDGSDDALVKQTLDKMYWDVVKCIGVDETWGGLAIRTEMTGHEVSLEREELLEGSILITFELNYRHRRWDITTPA